MKKILGYLTALLCFIVLLLPYEAFAEPSAGGISDAPSPMKTGYTIIKTKTDSGDFTYQRVKTEKYHQLESRSVKSVGITEAPDIEFVQEENMVFADTVAVQTRDTDFPYSWGSERTGVTQLADQFFTKDTVTVAVIDSGVDYNHPLLKKRMVGGYDFIDNDNDPMDLNDHGTLVAGIIASSTPSNVKIMPVRVLDADGKGEDLNLADSIRYAADHNADIINMSVWGAGDSPVVDEAIAYAHGKGVVLVVCAGNAKADTKFYHPANNPTAIVVSAMDMYDEPASFSNFGDTVDIAGPGLDLESATIGGGYGPFSGTSAATPYVASAAAMLKLEDLSRTTEQVEKLLLQYTDDKGERGKDPYFGEGILNVSKYDMTSSVKYFSIISPQNYSSALDELRLKIVTHGAAGKTATILLEDRIIKKQQIQTDGYQVITVPLTEIDSGYQEFTVKVGSDIEVIEVAVSNTSSSFSLKTLDNQLSNRFDLTIYGFNPGETPEGGYGVIEELSSTGTVLSSTIDLTELQQSYESVVAVGWSSNSQVPVYVRELHGNGIYTFEPKGLQKLTFINELTKDAEEQNGSISLQPFFNGNLLGQHIVREYAEEGPIVLYTDTGNHRVSFQGNNYLYETTMKNSENRTSKASKETMFPLTIETGLTASETQKGDFVNVQVQQEPSTLFSPEWYFPINNHKKTLYFSENTYRANLFSMKKDGQTKLSVTHPFSKETSDAQPVFKFGGTLTGGFLLDENADQLTVKVDIRDSYSNEVVFDYGDFEDLYGDYSIVSLINSSGRHWRASISGNNEFEFEQSIPDGTYTLKYVYQNKFYPVRNKELPVQVENGKFTNLQPQPPSQLPPDEEEGYTKEFTEQYRIAANKVWTVNVNRDFSEKEVQSISVWSGTRNHPVRLESKPAYKKILVHPVSPYNLNDTYILEVKLTNGKSYKLKFHT